MHACRAHPPLLRHSGCMPASANALDQACNCSGMKAASSAGVVLARSKPSLSTRSRMSGRAITAAYLYDGSTLSQITDPDFPGAVTVGYLDGYFVFNEPNSQKFWVTQLLDGTSVDPLDFASAEGSPDDLTSLIIDHREVWVYGTNSVEVWYDAGTQDFPLQRIQGAFNEIGCISAYTIAKMDNGSDMRQPL